MVADLLSATLESLCKPLPTSPLNLPTRAELSWGERHLPSPLSTLLHRQARRRSEAPRLADRRQFLAGLDP